MAGISGLGTTFNLPNYVGELYSVTPEDTPLLSAIGGLTGGEETLDTRFAAGQTYDLRDPGQNTRVEGAAAPTAEERVRAGGFNVVQIHQEAVEVSYTRQAVKGRLTAVGSNVIAGSNPVADEMAWQVETMLKQIARDVEYSFIRGTFDDPANNSTARRTRGILAAITSNVSNIGAAAVVLTTPFGVAATDIFTSTAHGLTAGQQIQFTALTGGTGLAIDTIYYVIAANLAANTFSLSTTLGGAMLNFTSDVTAGTFRRQSAITQAAVLNLMQLAWENGGIRESAAATVIVNAWQKRELTRIFVTEAGFQNPGQRNVGGVSLQTLETDFGRVNFMLNRYMPIDQIAVVSLDQMAPVHLNIPGKGFLFTEDLAKVGASERKQLYGEVGLRYGNERNHAKLTGLQVATS